MPGERESALGILQEIARRAMIERGLAPDFPLAALDELEAIRAPAGGSPSSRDLRTLAWASIDNDDSRDLDQLSVADALPDGACRILVAIADVDAPASKGSAIDGHAEQNTTSVYTAARIFPIVAAVAARPSVSPPNVNEKKISSNTSIKSRRPTTADTG